VKLYSEVNTIDIFEEEKKSINSGLKNG
jgi:hypothetical protein